MTQLTSLTTVELLRRLAEAHRDRVAFSGDPSEQPITFGAFWRRVSSLATGLRTRGVQPGDRVAIALPSCIDWSVWEHASQLVGAVPVGLGLLWSREHTAAVLADCKPTVIVLPEPSALSVLDPETVGQCRLVCLRNGADTMRSGSTLCGQADLYENATGHEAVDLCQADSPATIIYTSGTTGKPKGVVHTHARVLAAVHAILELFPELQGSRLALSWMPMEHLFQRMLNLVALSLGIESSILPEPRNLLSAARSLRPTFLAGVPLIFEQLLREAKATPGSFDSWRRELVVMIVGSAPISRDVLQELQRLSFPVTQAYSTSECLVPIASNTLSANRLGSVGKPLRHYELKISEAGEILVRGLGVFNGYYGSSKQQTAALFDEHGFYHTGDLGYLDDDGYLFITGRSTDLIKTANGRKISPFEIETAYKQSPRIEQIVVSGHGRPHLAALVQLDEKWTGELRSALGVSGDGGRWADDERSIGAVLSEMQRYETSLDAYKRVRRIAVLLQPLSVERGELTSTFKLRRDVIEQRYQEKLDKLTGSA